MLWYLDNLLNLLFDSLLLLYFRLADGLGVRQGFERATLCIPVWRVNHWTAQIPLTALSIINASAAKYVAVAVKRDT